jgi:hypothetical protein
VVEAGKLHLITLIAFEYGVRGVRACLRREAAVRCAGADTHEAYN